MARLYDISPPLGASIAVFPGDSPLSREVLLEHARGDNLTLSTLRSTVHLGAHADAPSHYQPDGETIDRCELSRYLGPCQLLSVSAGADGLVGKAVAERIDQPRVLFRTASYPDPNHFNDDFVALAPELVDALAERAVRLVGVDTPSVDPARSKALPAHLRFAARGILILEGLVFDGVPDGSYQLIALPLKLVGFDASPVRAVLIDRPGDCLVCD
ncbi:MAG: cyclase family protein [Deltaproteobacteria bacterium]|nr:cyclase family protein [Deltaproteobacteria bacterium]